ncbi:hypothetical protein DL95DRAFT_318765, partial [Leptodontidium sp. 2 PMI_412]
ICEFTKNYYIYTLYLNPSAYFMSTFVEGKKDYKCLRAFYEQYIVVTGYY